MTKPPVGRDSQKREVELQVRRMFGQSRAFAEMPREEQERILANTTAIVDTMAQNKLAQAAGGDPYAVPFIGELPKLPGSPGSPGSSTSGTPAFTGGAQPGATAKLAPQKLTDFGAGLAVGVGQAGELLRQVNFPAFVVRRHRLCPAIELGHRVRPLGEHHLNQIVHLRRRVGDTRNQHVELELDALVGVAQTEDYRALRQHETAAEDHARSREQARQLVSDTQSIEQRVQIEQSQVPAMEEVEALAPALPSARDGGENRN